MKKFLMMLMVVLASSVMFITDSAEAARIGGGRSVGRQNSTIQRAAPAQQNNAMANNRQQQAANQASNGRRPGFGMGLLGGLAAGLGLSALASAFGLGEGSGVFLLMLLLAGLAIFSFRMFGKRLQQQQQAQAAGSGAPFAGNLRDAFNSGEQGQNDMFRQNSNATGGLFSQTPAVGAAQVLSTPPIRLLAATPPPCRCPAVSTLKPSYARPRFSSCACRLPSTLATPMICASSPRPRCSVS